MKYVPKVGDKVSIVDLGSTVLGTVWEILNDSKIYIKRDDKITGGGKYAPGYGCTWVITYCLSKWDYKLKPLKVNWKERIKDD